MISRPVERLLSNLRVRLPGVLDSALKLELFNVLDEFFQGSNVWTEEVTLPVVSARLIYELETEATANVVRLLGVYLNGSPIQASLADPLYLVLRNAPSSGDSYTVNVSLTVTDPVNSDGLPFAPDWVYTKYRAAIEDGVLAKMFSQPAKPYTSETYARYHGRRFRGAIASASRDANRLNVRGGQRWAFPQTFATRRQ